MTTPTELAAHYDAQTQHPRWQHKLRQSVRLLLALTEPGLNPNALHAALCLVEDELQRQLLASLPEAADSAQAPAAAARVLHRAQQDLLTRWPEHEALRQQVPVTEFTLPLRRTCRPPQREDDWAWPPEGKMRRGLIIS
jgi:hypothetical protein